MNLENKFIKQLEAYLFQEYSDYDKKRILSFLEEYKTALNIEEKIVIKEVVREVKVYEKVENIPVEFPIRKYKQLATGYVLQQHAKKMCEENNIDYKKFRKKSRTTTMDVTLLRKEFCHYIINNYEVKLTTLGEFFGLHHATISYYLYGSSYTRKTNRKYKINVERKYKPKSLTTNTETI